MTEPWKLFARFHGNWTGTSRTWFDPDSEPKTGPWTSQCLALLGTRFLEKRYGHELDGAWHSGVMTLGFERNRQEVVMIWMDSFHMDRSIMYCTGSISDHLIQVEGSYDAPTGPPWRWRTEFDIPSEGQFPMRAFNITPDSKAYRALEVDYKLKTPPAERSKG